MPLVSRNCPVILLGAAALALTACQNMLGGQALSADHAIIASASLAGPDGTAIGTATLTPLPDGLLLRVGIVHLADGPHGIHLHMVGKCEGPKFDSAGAHWNPDGRKHGLENPDGVHAGDLPNIVAVKGAVTQYSHKITGASLTMGGRALLDADGAALIIHAEPDDNVTDPSGNSGARLICGVFHPV